MSSTHRAKALVSGRIAQKKRTRDLLLRTARELMARGQPITVAQTANEAGISTATAYRYFPDPETLKLEAAITFDAEDDEVMMAALRAKLRGETDISKRVIAVHRLMVNHIRSNESGLRLFIASGHSKLAADTGERLPGFARQRISLLTYALQPVRLKLGEMFEDVLFALASATGHEAYFVLKDVCRLPEHKIAQISEANLRVLVRHLIKA